MLFPTIAYVGSASQALPLLAGLRHGRALPTVRRLIVAWAIAGLAFDMIAMQLAIRKINNLWLGYISAPTAVVMVLVALSMWPMDSKVRNGLRVLAAGFVVTVLFLVLFVEDTSRHSLVRRPLESFLVLSAALGVLLLMVREEKGTILQRDWFWVCCGLTFKYGASMAIDPVARLLMSDSRELVGAALQLRAMINVISYLIIARGIWCPLLPHQSSGRSF